MFPRHLILSFPYGSQLFSLHLLKPLLAVFPSLKNHTTPHTSQKMKHCTWFFLLFLFSSMFRLTPSLVSYIPLIPHCHYSTFSQTQFYWFPFLEDNNPNSLACYPSSWWAESSPLPFQSHLIVFPASIQHTNHPSLLKVRLPTYILLLLYFCAYSYVFLFTLIVFYLFFFLMKFFTA